MNRTKIAAVATAVGATLAAASSAWAITPANMPAALSNANSIIIPFSGATATDAVLLRLFHKSGAGQICAAGTIDFYFNGVGGTNPSNNKAFTCQTNDTLIPGLDTDGTLGNETRNVIFYKESVGGSGNGVLPVADASPLPFMNLNTLGSCGSVAGADPGLAYTERANCNTTLVNLVPLAGISDVDPAVNLATQTQIDNLSTSPAVQVVFGVPVTLNAYRALQAAQGLTQNDDRANIPSLTSAQIAGLYTGFISNWNQITNVADGGTPLASHPVFVCRRGQTSGTQASAEAVLLHQRCVSGVTEFVSPNDGSNAINGSAFVAGTTPSSNPAQNVYAASGSGQVRQCLDYHQATSGGDRWAVGVLSTENSPNNTDRRYRFVAIDGAKPALDEVVNSSYKYFTENTINWRNGSGVGTTPNFQQQALLDHIVANVGDPDTIAGINEAFRRTVTGNPVDGGLLAKPELYPVVSGANESAYTEAEVRTYPVNSQTRRNNNCQPALQNFDAVTPVAGHAP